VEHLHRMVGVEAGNDLRDRAEVAIDELAKTAVVIDRARARTSRDKELEVRDAEGVLDVDGQQAEAERVLGRRSKAVALGPRRRLTRAVLVRNPPDRADAAWLEVRRKRKLTHCAVESYTRPGWLTLLFGLMLR
jgi:hypothetical protein